ncbi:hypothetical protein MRX96_023423 [Rhipicephalus microplus]
MTQFLLGGRDCVLVCLGCTRASAASPHLGRGHLATDEDASPRCALRHPSCGSNGLPTLTPSKVNVGHKQLWELERACLDIFRFGTCDQFRLHRPVQILHGLYYSRMMTPDVNAARFCHVLVHRSFHRHAATRAGLGGRHELVPSGGLSDDKRRGGDTASANEVAAAPHEVKQSQDVGERGDRASPEDDA